MKIALIGSMNFIDEMNDIKQELIKLGHDAFFTSLADNIIGKDVKEKERIKLENKYYHDAIKTFWNEMQKADAVLVCNWDKNGIKNYIGGNTLMEIGFAYILEQKIFLLNPIPDMDYLKTEVEAINPFILCGDLWKIPT